MIASICTFAGFYIFLSAFGGSCTDVDPSADFRYAQERREKRRLMIQNLKNKLFK